MMKAALLFEGNSVPVYTEYREPVIQHDEELLITMRAAAIKHIDKSKAGGTHYSTSNDLTKAKVIGGDGVGTLGDGTRVYAIGVSGMIAERAVIEKNRMVMLPAGLDDATAAALPNAVIGSAMGLRFRAAMQRGDTVLINGATGFTGKIAVQVARHYGAKRVIVTGRNQESLQSLSKLGADETISLLQEDDQIIARLKDVHEHSPIDIVIDYLWGHPAELILLALKGRGSFTHRTRFISIGAVTGDGLQLSAALLRSVDLQLSGSGLGSWTKDQMQLLFSEILPEMFQLAANGKLSVDTVPVKLEDIAQLWELTVPDGKRLVVMI